MNKSIALLQQKFKIIKQKGYIKSVRRGSTGIGATFESLLGKHEESFELPDFHGIEIKQEESIVNLILHYLSPNRKYIL